MGHVMQDEIELYFNQPALLNYFHASSGTEKNNKKRCTAHSTNVTHAVCYRNGIPIMCQ